MRKKAEKEEKSGIARGGRGGIKHEWRLSWIQRMGKEGSVSISSIALLNFHANFKELTL